MKQQQNTHALPLIIEWQKQNTRYSSPRHTEPAMLWLWLGKCWT